MSDIGSHLPAAAFPAECDTDFVRLVQDALEHLYDYPYLQSHPLIERLQLDNEIPARERMRLLRTILLQTVEELNPGPGVAYRSQPARAYSVVNLRYVAGMTVEAAAKELAISDRQLYRDLQRAVQDLASLLWNRCLEAARDASGPAQLSSEGLLLKEAERLGSGVEEVCIQTLLEDGRALVQRLSEQRGVSIQIAAPTNPLVVRTQGVLAKQALLNVLSHAVQDAAPGTTVDVAAQALGARARIAITHRGATGAGSADLSPRVAEPLIRRLDGQWSTRMDSAGQVTVTMTLGDRMECHVLVIDDSEGLHELFHRYLGDQPYRLSVARSGREGLQLARETLPDAVVLDVLMPQGDGWEVLRSLSSEERTRHIPVVVCSVLNDPQLALSLGAVDTLTKPVNRADLLRALSRCRRRIPPG